MRTRILFVDDEPNVLAGLRRMLRPRRDEWEMEFATSAKDALQRLEQAPYDVVISDMRMPGMDGAQFFGEVLDRFPQTVRIVLSGQSSREAVLKSVGPTHQYLAKPCDAEALQGTIDRALRLRNLIGNDETRGLVARMKSVPSMPELYLRLMEELRSEDASVQKVASIIARDAAMTAKILQLVNSAFFGLPHTVAKPEQAILQLGFETVRALVLSVHVFSTFQSSPSRVSGLERIWTHSLRTATLARDIGGLEGAKGSVSETAFTAGLLHELGKLILIANVPADYAQALLRAKQEGMPAWQAERDAFGASHAELGAYLVGLWGLPDSITEALAYHHQPRACPLREFSALTLVHIADLFEYQHAASTHGDVREGELDTEYLGTLRLRSGPEEWQGLLEGKDEDSN